METHGLFPEDVSEEEKELIQFLQNNTPAEKLHKRYGSRELYYYKRKTLFKKYKISNEINIVYEKLGLTRFFVLGKDRYQSPYLVQTAPYYIISTQDLSQFVIPLKFESKFIDKIIQMNPNVTIYKAKELAHPRYSFKNFKTEISHEERLFRWTALLMEEKFPELAIPDHSSIDFDFNMLQILQYQFQGVSRKEIIKKLGITQRRDYDAAIEKMEDILYRRILSINSIRKFLYIAEKIPEKVGALTLINSFMELFLYCHPFQIEKYYPEPTYSGWSGLLCLFTPPTPHIPFFHHISDNFLEVDTILALVGEISDSFNLNQVYDPTKGDWIWDDLTVQTIK